MSFQKATKQVAYSKIGAFGPTGSGKTTLTAMLLLYVSKELCGGKPVAFLDTEKGSDFIQPFFEMEGVDLLVDKTRAFTSLRNAHTEAIKAGACALGVDSLTHFWQELLASIKSARNASRLDIAMIGQAKDQWHQFTEAYVTSNIHYLIAGRLGNDWENVDVEDEKGNIKNELIKAGTKMKAEGDTGYETDLLLELSSADDPNAADYKKLTKGGRVKKLGSSQIHVAVVKKCRVRELNGKLFSWPDEESYQKGDYKKVAECFLPYFRFLNIGGQHVGFDSAQNSRALFTVNGQDKWKQRKEVALEEFTASVALLLPGQDATTKRFRTLLMEGIFGVRSWAAVQTKPVTEIENGLQAMLRFEKLAKQRTEPFESDEQFTALIQQAKDELAEEAANPVGDLSIGAAEEAVMP